MARLGCYCGNTLSNVECPSKDIIRVFFKEKVDTLLKENSKLELWDVYSEEEEYDFWHCDQCGRIYACPIPGQNVNDSITFYNRFVFYVRDPYFLIVHAQKIPFISIPLIEIFPQYMETIFYRCIQQSIIIDKHFNTFIYIEFIVFMYFYRVAYVFEVTTDEKEFDK